MNTRAKAYQQRLQARLERVAEDREYAALRARAGEPFDQASHSLFALGADLARIEWPAAHDAMLAATVGYPPNDGHSVKS